MRNATMVYKAPGPHPIHGAFFDYKIIDADNEAEVEAALSEGWFFTTPEAAEAYEVEKAERDAKLAPAQFASDGVSAPATTPKTGNKKTAAAGVTPASGDNVGTERQVASWGGVSAPAAQ